MPHKVRELAPKKVKSYCENTKKPSTSDSSFDPKRFRRTVKMKIKRYFMKSRFVASFQKLTKFNCFVLSGNLFFKLVCKGIQKRCLITSSFVKLIYINSKYTSKNCPISPSSLKSYFDYLRI